MIAGFLAQGLDAFDAAAAGVAVHAECGRIAERRIGAASTLAIDLLRLLPEVRRSLNLNALRTGAPIVAVWCFRKGAGRYRLAARRLPLPIATGDRARDTDAGMRVVLDALEDAIRSAPGQWGVTVPVWSGLVADR